MEMLLPLPGYTRASTDCARLSVRVLVLLSHPKHPPYALYFMLHDNLQRYLSSSLDIMQQDMFEEAAPLLERALTIGTAVFGSDRPDVARILL